MLNIPLSVIHAIFAVYLQRLIVRGMGGGSKKPDAAPGQDGSPEEPAAVEESQPLTSEVLLKRAGRIMLYDIGFCVYVFTFIGSFVFNCAGLKWHSSCSYGSSLPALS